MAESALGELLLVFFLMNLGCLFGYISVGYVVGSALKLISVLLQFLDRAPLLFFYL